ncbi:MAG: hypothetical protein GY723_04480 [bacterium]|nr:hypothetical protein [bacterium]MCP5067349.1 hypothetical protein [bacterium]
MTSLFRADSLEGPSAFESDPLFGEDGGFISREAAVASSFEEQLAAAFEEGRQAGSAELPWDDVNLLRSAADALATAGESLALIQRDGLRSQRVAIVDLALAIASHLVAREIQADPDALAAQLADALELLQGHAPPMVHLSPSDYEVLRSGGAPSLERLAGDWGATLAADEELAAGQARVEGGENLLEIELDRALARIREELLEANGESR